MKHFSCDGCFNLPRQRFAFPFGENDQLARAGSMQAASGSGDVTGIIIGGSPAARDSRSSSKGFEGHIHDIWRHESMKDPPIIDRWCHGDHNIDLCVHRDEV